MHEKWKKANALTDAVIAAAVAVQKHFGIGVLESIYVRCLERELQLAGHKTSREKGINIVYRGMKFDENLRYDLLVDDCLLIEAKATEKENMEIWRMQLLSYMKLMDMPLGLVINFGNDALPRRGVKRVILKGADVDEVPHETEPLHGNLDRFGLPSARSAGRRQAESVEIPRATSVACVPTT